MEKKLHKIITIVSLVMFLIGLIGLIMYLKNGVEEWLAAGYFIILASVIIFLSSYAIINQEMSWIRKLAKYSLFLFPVLMGFIIPVALNLQEIGIILLIVTVPMVIGVLALMNLFIFDDAITIKGTLVLLLFIVLTILYKRYHFQYSSVAFTGSMSLFTVGILMYGIRCLYLAEKNTYFRYLSLFGCCLITFTFLGLLFKTQHWPIANALIMVSNFLMVIGTIVVLVTLPSSNYFDWKILHKKIIRRLLIPWVFIFLLFLFRFLVPGAWGIIWSAEQTTVPPGFGLVDYSIESKNGLKPQ